MVNPYPNLPPAARLCRNVILRRMPKNLALANTSKSEMLRFALSMTPMAYFLIAIQFRQGKK
jgi:hypothetical protein